MKYNFDEIIDRKNNHSTKYNELIKSNKKLNLIKNIFN